MDRALHAQLESLRRAYGATYRCEDPVRFPHAYKDPRDREVVGLLASALAFGRVDVILRNVATLVGRLGDGPADTLRALDARRARAVARGLVHRWIGPAELGRLLIATGALLRRFGTLEGAFAAGDDPAAHTIEPGLAAFSAEARLATGRPRDRAVKFLFPSPASGGACKRLNLFLRWVARPADGIDLGLWTAVVPARLLIPLDVHVAFHARALGFSRRRQADWKMVTEVTGALRAFDPADPVKYDFALCHAGMRRVRRRGLAG